MVLEGETGWICVVATGELRADKSAMGAINRPLQRVGTLLEVNVWFVDR